MDAPVRQRLAIKPVRQAPGLCGVTAGEMILSFYGVKAVGKGQAYRISDRDGHGGAALGQAVCDLLATNPSGLEQPRCEDDQGRPIAVYKDGAATPNTLKAYPDGTWLSSLRPIFERHGIKTAYKPSRFLSGRPRRYNMAATGASFEVMLGHLRRGHPVIFHVSAWNTPTGGHFLLATGYDDATGTLHYIDPEPLEGDAAQGTVSYGLLKQGERWFRQRWFFTGRFLAVVQGPERVY